MTAAIILALLQVADSVTTLWALSLWARERNPVMTWCFDHFGERPVLIAKSLGVSAIGIWLATNGYELAVWALVVFYVVVVANNARVIRKQKQEVPYHPV